MPSISRRSVLANVVVSLLAALTCAVAPVHAQDSVPAAAAEGGRLWFIELSGSPVADGNTIARVQAEKAAFRRSAAAAGIRYTERRAFDVLFNGFSVEIDAADRMKLAQLPGVKAVYPVEIVAAPTPEQTAGAAPDLAAAIVATGAKAAQDSLGLTGRGVRVGIIDSGIDIDHPAFGGSGVPGSSSFPTARVVAGYDLVGDNYNSTGTPAQQVPVPDPVPDDCGGHGTHVAGIVGANSPALKGVAPGVSLGAYRVFGCDGTSSADIIIEAMERALADGMQVVNQSLGAARQWPQYPTAQAATRMVNRGVVMVASIGNNGPGGSAPDALFAAGAPGVGEKVIGVASYDNTQITQSAFLVNPGGDLIGYNLAAGAPPPPASGSAPLARTGTPASANDGCLAAQFAGFPAGAIALIRRGTCAFAVKAANAQAAGASAVVLYNNAPGPLNPTVAGGGIVVPVVAVSDTAGVLLNVRMDSGPVTLTWTQQSVSTPVATGGLISSFSSYGLAADLSLKPNLGAPGGNIFSSYPIELGGYASLSGTSMSSPHVAGGVALLLEADPRISSNAMRTRLQNSADPKAWSGNPGLGFLDHVHRQGAGMLDIVGSIEAKTVVEPSQLSLGESEHDPAVRTIVVRNTGQSSVTYDLSHVGALATGPNSQTGASYVVTGVFNAPASVSFSVPSITVPANGSSFFDVTVTAHGGLTNRAIYGGYIVLTPQGGGAVYRVPYAGFKGDYQSTMVLTPTANGFPWLAQLVGASYVNRAAGGTYTMVGTDIPYFLMHLDHPSRRIRLEAFDAVSGKSWHRVSDDEYVTRNSTPGGFFAFQWDGTTFAGKGKNDSQWYRVPNGRYVVKVSVLKALGDESNPAHWETWTSPTITIARP